MIADIYERSKLLSTTCLKIALVLPQEKAISHIIRNQLIDCASDLAIKAKGLMATQNPEYFLKKLSAAKEAADGVNYWLELVKDESLLDATIIDPIKDTRIRISHTNLILSFNLTDPGIG